MKKKNKKSSKFSRGKIISIGVTVSIFVLIGIYAQNSLTPVNSEGMVFAPTSNIFLKAVQSSQGYYHYQHTKGGKSVPYAEGESPPITVTKGNLVQIHLINEEKNEQDNFSKHDLNIDEFNVHTKKLSYFQSDSITFLADKVGKFDYYCSIHPDMKGTIIVTE